MIDRPTPHTDASRGYALSSHYGRLDGSYLQMDQGGPFVHAEVARKLERERDEALSQIVQAECRAERFCQERDDARNDIVGWENKWKCAIEMAARAELERDDAFNKLKELKDILR